MQPRSTFTLAHAPGQHSGSECFIDFDLQVCIAYFDGSGLPQLRFDGVYGSIPAPQITIAILDDETIIGITTLDGANKTMVMATADATTLLLTRSAGLNEGDAEVRLSYEEGGVKGGESVDALTPTVVTMPAGNTSYAFSVSGLNNMLVAQPTRNIDCRGY